MPLTRNSALEFAVADFSTPVNPATPTSVAAAPTCVATQFNLGLSVTGHDIQCSPCCASSEVLALFAQDPEVSAPSDLSSTPAVEYVLQEVAAHTATVIPRYTDHLSYLSSSPAAVLELQKVTSSVLYQSVTYLYKSGVEQRPADIRVSKPADSIVYYLNRFLT